MKKVNWFKVGISVLIIAGLIFSSCKAKQDQKGTDPITGEKYPQSISIGTLYGAPQTAIAIQEGFFNDLGINVTVLYFDSGRDVNTAFVSGSIVAGSFGSSPIALGISNNLNYEVVFLNDVIGTSESLAVKSSSGIKTIADLAGKKIAAPFASTAHYSLLNALKLGGIDQNSLTILDMQPQDILAAWVRGDIDGAYVWTPVLDELLKNGGISLTDSGKLAEQGAITADLTAVSKDFAKKYPTLTTRYVLAFIKSYRILKNDPDKAVRLIAKDLEIDEATAREQIVGNNYLSPEEQLSAKFMGSSGNPGALADTLKNTADFHVTQNNLTNAADLSAYRDSVNPAFIEAALKLEK